MAKISLSKKSFPARVSLSKKSLLVADAKVTLITTCLNEEKSIEKFLTSVAKQTRQPDELIIVDGGSTDATLDLIQKAKVKSQNFKLKLKIIVRKGNRSVGRNMAIESSTGDIISCSDVGCELSVNWLERIIKPFEDRRIDVVAGFYKPITTSVFEQCLASYTCTMPDRLNKNKFLPSSRSIAFRKKAWRSVGGYPENLDTCEDLVFDKKLKNAGAKFIIEENAIVYWPQRKNIWQAARQFYSYAVGDGQARFFRRSTPLLFVRYIIGICLVSYVLISMNYNLISIILILLILYAVWSIWKNYKYVKNIRALYILPALQFISDVAVMGGTIRGLLKF